MKKYMVLIIILLASSFLLNVYSNVGEESIYTKIHSNNENDTNEDDSNSGDQINYYTDMTEEMAVEKMFSYLREQNHQPSKGFQIHLKRKEQKLVEENYMMHVYSLVGEDERLSSKTIGLYAVDKTTGEIVYIN